MCPEPALLVAHRDGTLLHRDARAVDDHVLTCASCTIVLATLWLREPLTWQAAVGVSLMVIGALITRA